MRQGVFELHVGVVAGGLRPDPHLPGPPLPAAPAQVSLTYLIHPIRALPCRTPSFSSSSALNATTSFLFLTTCRAYIPHPYHPHLQHSTRVAASCSATSYQPASHRRLTIGVYGYAAAAFTLLVAAAGDITQLPR